ncbi:carboxypeptidase-like regulatory domain-containing protein [Actinoplanes utahensis]|uniref:alpha-amylase n=1 Tax=Actinoplanes utahensis TaxID=1869 RepID=A0A0A6UDT9_ACTUT|nr:carboxypeptidase-like regulatory domain-containing protein [Actinoplanes utahensis]KHD74200.1 hypothetical protein MB27_30085 [Actinoplanes utahensis]GIF31142.1 hypothetical protein Aut01nite_41280 [Actinoplanes utahensis]
MQRRKFAAAVAGLAVLGIVAPGAASPAVAAVADGGIISGRVVNTSGHVLANARISAEPLDRDNGTYLITETDASGAFTLPGLVPGQYRVGIDAGGWGEYAPGRRFTIEQGVQYQVREGRRTIVNSLVFAAGTISGKVTDAAGKPAAGVPVSAFDSVSRLWYEEFTAADGGYALKVRPNTPYVLRFADGNTSQYAPSGTTDAAQAGHYQVAPGRATRVDARLIVAPTLTGRLTDAAGAPVADAHVSYTSRGRVYEFTSTDADGRYTFTKVPLDDLKVRFVTASGQEQWATGSADSQNATWFTTAAGVTTVVDERLLPAS